MLWGERVNFGEYSESFLLNKDLLFITQPRFSDEEVVLSARIPDDSGIVAKMLQTGQSKSDSGVILQREVIKQRCDAGLCRARVKRGSRCHCD